MKMEVLAVQQQQYQWIFGGFGSNKMRDWTSTLTPPLSAQLAATSTDTTTTTTTTATTKNLKSTTSPLTMTVKTSAAVAAALNANNNSSNGVSNSISSSSILNTPTITPYHNPHHQHNHHNHHRQMATTNKMKNSIINKKTNRTVAVEATTTTTTATGNVRNINSNTPTTISNSSSNNISNNIINNNNNNNNNNILYCDKDIDATAVDELSLRLLDELRAAKSRHLTCTEVSLPCDLTPSIAAEIIRVSEKEPCGIRGCTIYIEFEDEPNNSRRIASLKLDPETVSTFEVYLTLRQDHRGWTALLPQFMKNLARTITISPQFTITKHKLYSPQQRSSSSSYMATTATAAISTPSS